MDLTKISALSAVMADISKSITTAHQQLTSIPLHPYEAAKKMFFEDGHKFPVIEDIKVPEGVTTEGLIEKITEIQKNYQNNLLDYVSNPSQYNIQGEGEQGLSILAELSGTNTFVVTKDKYKGYLEFLELLKTIDINSLTKENSNEIIQKIGYSLVNCLNSKTINS